MNSSKINLLLIFPLFIFSTSINAQVRKDTVGIADFSTQVTGASQFLNLFTENLIEKISLSLHFKNNKLNFIKN